MNEFPPPRALHEFNWNDERNITNLRTLWAEGHSTAEIGRRMGVTKNCIVGKAHRLELPSRPSPIIRTYNNMRPATPRIPRVVGRTIPPLPSEGAETMTRSVVPPPVVPASKNIDAAWKSDIKQAAARKKGALTSLVARGEPGHISPFDNVSYRPVRAEIAQPYVSPVAKCAFPLWGNNERPTHRYCEALVYRRSYCREHSDLCYNRIRDLREPVAA